MTSDKTSKSLSVIPKIQRLAELVYFSGVGLDPSMYFRYSNIKPSRFFLSVYKSQPADTHGVHNWKQRPGCENPRYNFAFNVNMLLAFARHYEQLLADHNSCDYFITVHNAYAIHFNDDKSGPRFNINQSIVLIEMYRSGKLSIQPCEACGSNIVTDCNQFAICPFCDHRKRDRLPKWLDFLYRPTSGTLSISSLPTQSEIDTEIFYFLLNGFSPRVILEFYGSSTKKNQVIKIKDEVTRFLNCVDQTHISSFYRRHEGWYCPTSPSSSAKSCILNTTQTQASFNLLIICTHFHLRNRTDISLFDVLSIYRMYMQIDRSSDGIHEVFSPNLAYSYIRNFVDKRISLVRCKVCGCPIALHLDANYDPSCPVCDEIYYPCQNVSSRKRFSKGGVRPPRFSVLPVTIQPDYSQPQARAG